MKFGMGLSCAKTFFSSKISIFGENLSFSFQVFIPVGFAISWILKATLLQLSIQTYADGI